MVFAFGGLTLTLITENPLFDALGGAGVGVALIIAVLSLAKEIGSLLMGEALTDKEETTILEAITGTQNAKRIINM